MALLQARNLSRHSSKRKIRQQIVGLIMKKTFTVLSLYSELLLKLWLSQCKDMLSFTHKQKFHSFESHKFNAKKNNCLPLSSSVCEYRPEVTVFHGGELFFPSNSLVDFGHLDSFYRFDWKYLSVKFHQDNGGEWNLACGAAL